MSKHGFWHSFSSCRNRGSQCYGMIFAQCLLNRVGATKLHNIYHAISIVHAGGQEIRFQLHRHVSEALSDKIRQHSVSWRMMQ